ncbi:MAG: hemerythrin domain-containing protein [Elusimicrobiota bacterium]
MQTAQAGVVTVADVLRMDHEVIADLFRRHEGAASDRRKKVIGDRCLRKIEVHALLEEKIFYPAVRRDLGEDRLVAQALAEHAAARRVVDELRRLPAGERYNERFRALKDILFTHIDEEETVLLPRVEKSDMDIEQLGAQLLEKKRRIASGVVEEPGERSIAAAAVAAVVLAGAVALLAAGFSRRRRASLPG